MNAKVEEEQDQEEEEQQLQKQQSNSKGGYHRSHYNNNYHWWHYELQSLGIEPKRKNELNDKEELEALADTIKQVYYQDYKAAYGDKEIDESHFDYII
jgi:hypothetical protein